MKPGLFEYALETVKQIRKKQGLLMLLLEFTIGLPLNVPRLLYRYRAFRRTLAADDSISSHTERTKSASERSSIYLGEALIRKKDGIPESYWFDAKRLGRNGHAVEVAENVFTSGTVMGSPGSGKTRTAVSLACGNLEDPRRVVVYLDLKADEPWVFRTLQHRCAELGRKFFYVSTEGEPSLALNPVELLADTAPEASSFCKHLVQALGIGQGLNHGFFENEARSFLQTLLSLYPDASSFSRMLEAAKNPDDKKLYPTKNRFENVAGVRSALEEYANVSQFSVSRYDTEPPDAVRDNAVDFQRMVKDGGCCLYVRARRFHGLIPLLCRALFEGVRAVNAERPEDQMTPVALYCDELHRALPYSPELFGELIALSRAVRLMPVTFIFQNLAQVKGAAGKGADGNSLVSELLSCPVTLYGGSTDNFTANQIAEEWCSERFVTHGTTTSVTSGDSKSTTEAYVRIPRVRQSLLEWLSTSAGTAGCFLARVARSKDGFYSLAQASLATDYATFKRLEALGWPHEDEFPGAVVAKRVPIFGPSTSAASTKKKSSVRALLGKFA